MWGPAAVCIVTKPVGDGDRVPLGWHSHLQTGGET